MISKKMGVMLLASIAVLIIFGLLWLKPMAQTLAYHNFADQRSWFGIANAVNVLSNIPLALVGIWGLFLLFMPGKVHFIDRRERWPWVGVAGGLILVALGSGYYHLTPDNAHLMWDRLPMTIVFMSFVTALVDDRVSVNFGLWLWPVLLGIGIYSVLQWYFSEMNGAGDLRLYAAVQAYAIAVALIMLLLPSRYTRGKDLALVVVFYGLAKLFEMYDRQIYLLDKNIISGHTLKHLAAALAGMWLLRMVWKRKVNTDIV